MSFRQCEAIKKDGEQCRKIARAGSRFCHSHRNYRLKAAPPNLINVPELALALNKAAIVPLCEDCGEVLDTKNGLIVYMHHEDGSPYTICYECGLFQWKIETQIQQIAIDHQSQGGVPSDVLQSELEKFGIDKEITERARRRMVRDGRLIQR